MFAAHTLFHTPMSTAAASTVIPYAIPFLIPAAAPAHYTDDFNRSNSASLGAAWTTDPAFGVSLSITSNAATGPTTGAGNVYASTMNTDDHKVTVVMKGATAGDQVFIALRVNSTSATEYVYAYLTQGGTWGAYRSISDGSPATASSQSWVDGDTVSFEAQGTTATLKLNGSTIVSASSVTVTSGRYVALDYISASTVHGFDSFDATDI